MESPIPEPRPIHSDRDGEVPVFVGRERELRRLKQLWDSPSVESSVVKLANMPGIGKTALARQLLRTFGRAENALCLEIDSKDLISAFDQLDPRQAARESFTKCVAQLLPQIQWYMNLSGRAGEFQAIERLVTRLEQYPAPTFLTLLNHLFDLPQLRECRTLFLWDEIQALYGVGQELFLTERKIRDAQAWRTRHVDEKITRQTCGPLYETLVTYEQGAFRPATKTIASLLDPGNRLIVISGTQYRFLNKLEDLGSPLRRRTVQLKLNRLPVVALSEWFTQCAPLPEDPALERTWAGLRDRIVFSSGGIPGFFQVFMDLLPQNPDVQVQLLEAFRADFETAFKEVVKVAREALENYTIGLIEHLFGDYGELPARQFLARLARHALFHDYITATEVTSLIASVAWGTSGHSPDWTHIVELGLLLIVNGDVEEDYLRHPEILADGRLPENALAYVCPFQMDLLRRRYVDEAWLDAIGLDLPPATRHLVAMHPGIVGFAAEYYLALRLVSLTKAGPFPLVEGGVSPYFSADSLPRSSGANTLDIILPPLRGVNAAVPLNLLDPEEGVIYLLPRAEAVDGVVLTETHLICYQVKFTRHPPSPSRPGTAFFSRFDAFLGAQRGRNDGRIPARLFLSLSAPGDSLRHELVNHEFLICAGTGFRALMSERLVDWLCRARDEPFSL